MHISITGNLGSGKSTVCNYLKDKYGFEVYSTGKIQRSLARELGLSTLEMNELMRIDKKYDDMIDNRVAQIAREEKLSDILFDSRMAWNFAPHSYKAFVFVDSAVAARRVYADKRGLEETYESLEDAQRKIAARAGEERIRFKEIYGVDYMDYNNYNLVIDSSYCSPEHIAETIYKKAIAFSTEKTAPNILISPDNLYPSKPVGAPEQSDGVTVVRYSDRHIIADGHQRVIAAKARQEPLVEVKIIESLPNGAAVEDYVKSCDIPSVAREYSDRFGFSYMGMYTP